MGNREKDLSRYIDMLNSEKEPEKHGLSEDSRELEELFDTVRVVRSLKEPDLPNSDYPKKLAQNVAGRLMKKNQNKRVKGMWFIGVGTVAAVIAIALTLNFIAPFNKDNIAYAMGKAFQKVEAYHGFLEVVQTNAEGKESIQAKLEVWADKKGNYYVKGLAGSQQDIITANNGQRKWQVLPGQKQVHVLPAFPDSYRFTFELGKEVEEIKNALSVKVVGEDIIAGRPSSIVEVYPQGGETYRIWIDKENKLPLQKQSGMQNALRYKATYTKIDFSDYIPAELITYKLPGGFKEMDTKSEEIVSDLVEAHEIVGFSPGIPRSTPAGYSNDVISVEKNAKLIKLNFASQDKKTRVVILQSKSVNEFKPTSTAVLGKVGANIAEIQSPVQESLGVLGGAGPYAGVTDISSIRWQESGVEYAVVGNASLEELTSFIRSLTTSAVDITSIDVQSSNKPQIEVPADLEAEGNEQKSIDGGHSPWRLDPAFVAQVFVSLKIHPQGIEGDYPIGTENLKVIQNTGKDALVEISGDKTPVRRVYLKRLIRQDSTGIWTVVGYDPAFEK